MLRQARSIDFAPFKSQIGYLREYGEKREKEISINKVKAKNMLHARGSTLFPQKVCYHA
jgi:hypothetical protein